MLPFSSGGQLVASRFLRKICSVIPLIVFAFVNFCIFNGRFVAWLHWSFLFSEIFPFFTSDLYHDYFCFLWILHFQRETCRRCGKIAMIPFGSSGRCHPKTACEKSARKKTAGEKAPSQYCRKKLQVRRCKNFTGETVARLHPKTACNLDWGPLECQYVASSDQLSQ